MNAQSLRVARFAAAALLTGPALAQVDSTEHLPVVTSPLVLIDEVNPEWPVEDTPRPVRIEPFELDEQQKQSLIAAPSVALNREPSDTLRNALERRWLHQVRADRVIGDDVDVLQGYVYYLAAPGQYLEVLCVSVPTFPVIWSHCQEEQIGPLDSF